MILFCYNYDKLNINMKNFSHSVPVSNFKHSVPGSSFLEPTTSSVLKDFRKMSDIEKCLYITTAKKLKDLTLIAFKMGEIRRSNGVVENGVDRASKIERVSKLNDIDFLELSLKEDFLKKDITSAYGFREKFVEIVRAKIESIKSKDLLKV